ncbi:conjugal transfer pilus assembly protein TraV [Gammaproteobacteria bacterium]
MRNFVMKKASKEIKEAGNIKKTKKEILRSDFAFVPNVFLLPSILFVLFLSGCVGMNSKFDCNVGSGGKCAPMNNINKMANLGEFNEGFLKYGTDKENAIAKAENKIRKENSYLSDSSRANGTPIRTNEAIQQIWIGPYEDSMGIYHEPTTVYAVVKKGRWVGASESTKVIEN